MGWSAVRDCGISWQCSLLFHDPSTVLHTLEVRLGQRTTFADMEYDNLSTKAIHMATGLIKRGDGMWELTVAPWAYSSRFQTSRDRQFTATASGKYRRKLPPPSYQVRPEFTLRSDFNWIGSSLPLNPSLLLMLMWLFHILIFATGKYQNKEKPLKRRRKLGLPSTVHTYSQD